MTNRRNFIQSLALTGTLAISLPDIVNAANIQDNTAIKFNNNDVVLFQGDSITDAGRDKKKGGSK
jgi:hypothetical protein